MTQPQGIEAVLFDLGGTLFEHLEATTSADNLRTAYLALPESVHTAVSSDDFVAGYRRLRGEVEREYVQRRFYLHRDMVAAAFIRAVSEQVPGPMDFGALRQCALAFCAHQRRSVVARLRPRGDFAMTLSELARRNIPCGIVSNIDEDYLAPLVAKHKLDRHFQFCLSSEAVGCCKPHRDFFDLALARLGVPASRVLFVGDSLAHDVIGANAVGMASCWLQPAAPDSHPATYVVAQLVDVLRCCE